MSPIGDLARQDEYDLPDVGLPLLSPGPQFSPGVPAVNRVADVLSRYPGHVMGSLASLPERAFGASEEMRAGGYYNPAPALETALMTMGTGGMAGVRAAPGEAVLGAGAIRKSPLEQMPQVAERYPETIAPVWKADPNKGGKLYEAKATSPEAEQVAKLRSTAQREIDAGNYTPYFDPAQRFDVNPANYPPVESTLGILAQRPGPKNAAAYQAAASPEAAARLDAAFQRGMLQKEGAGDWYMMGQLEKEFIKEHGPELGPRMFKERFADAMAATTGGASPKDNLMMAHYGNYLKQHGLPLPDKATAYPFPVGGRYAAGNMEQYQKMLMEGSGLTLANPKRYNFSGNYLGNRAGSTIDEQMMGLIEPGGALLPPKGAYGNYEQPVANRAAAAGVDPRYFQEVAWAGAKDAKDAAKGGYKAQPMIGIVNEAIERTHRITGMPREEIVRRGLVRGEIPIYGAAGAAGMGALARQDDYQP